MNKYLILVLLINFLFSACSNPLRKEDFLNQVSQENKNFRVRIRAFRDKADFGADGVNYQIQSNSLDESDWREIIVVHHDDGIDLKDDNIILANPTAGFAFVSGHYVVTLDAGKSWKIFRIIPEDPSCGINKVKLERDGTGKMLATCNGKEKELRSTNFGLDWTQ